MYIYLFKNKEFEKNIDYLKKFQYTTLLNLPISTNQITPLIEFDTLNTLY